MKDDHYMVLGVPKNASLKQIKKAFRSKASLYHPDSSISKNANRIMPKLVIAYNALKDKKKRKQYDLELMQEMYLKLVLEPSIIETANFFRNNK